MRTSTSTFLLVLLVAAGCQLTDSNPNWNPRKELPAWTYDAPWYYRPSEDLQAREKVGPDIPIYYCRSERVFVVHPGGHQVSGVPRLAVWVSNNQGGSWEKAGHFGADQTHFLFEAQADGRYWVRFVGPGQAAADVPRGMPNRIYIVDRQPPHVTVVVTPAPYKDEKRTQPYIYQPGQTITVEWAVRDANLEETTITLGMAFAKFPNNLVFMEIPETLKPRGCLMVQVPREAVGQGGILLRVKAADKAGNVGIGTTDVLHVAQLGEFPPYQAPPPPSQAPAPEPSEVLVEPAEPGNPINPIELTSQTGEPAGTPQPTPEQTTDDLPPRPLFLPSANPDNPAGAPKAILPEPAELSLASPDAGQFGLGRAAGPDLDPIGPSQLPLLVDEGQAAVAKTSLGPGEQTTDAAALRVIPAEPANGDEPAVLASEKATVNLPTTQPAEGAAPQGYPGLRTFMWIRRDIPASGEPQEVDPFDLIHQTHGTPGAKLGWPQAGAMIRGGTRGRLLGWLPAIAAEYKQVELQFSSNSRATWHTVAKDLRFGQSTARWDVPMVTSKQCFLRIVGVDQQGKRLLLAISPRFTVDTVVEGTTIGPLPIQPDK